LTDRLLGAVVGHVQFLVLTVPPPIRGELAGADGGRTWSRALGKFWEYLKASQNAKWAYVRSHPTGDDGREFAPHANIIFAQTLTGGALDADELRTAWSACLGWDQEIDVHLGFCNASSKLGATKLAHHCRYVERHFPGWRWAGQFGRWYGARPPKRPEPQKKRERGTCPLCGKMCQGVSLDEQDLDVIAVTEFYLFAGKPIPRKLLERMERPRDGPPPEPYRPKLRLLQSCFDFGVVRDRRQ
jgi:hypothetical protein